MSTIDTRMSYSEIREVKLGTLADLTSGTDALRWSPQGELVRSTGAPAPTDERVEDWKGSSICKQFTCLRIPTTPSNTSASHECFSYRNRLLDTCAHESRLNDSGDGDGDGDDDMGIGFLLTSASERDGPKKIPRCRLV